jgi:hypothetical protein
MITISTIHHRGTRPAVDVFDGGRFIGIIEQWVNGAWAIRYARPHERFAFPNATERGFTSPHDAARFIEREGYLWPHE